MDGIGSALENLVGKNAAEKALQPWWESIQDLLLYGLLGFGRSSSVQNIIHCNLHPKIYRHFLISFNIFS